MPEEKTKSVGMRAAKSGLMYVGGQVIASFSVLVLLILLARLLHPTSFGVYAIVIAFYTLLGIIGNFGLGTALRKKMPEKKTKQERLKLVSHTYLIATIIGLIIAGLGFIFSNAIATNLYHQPTAGPALQVASLLVIFWVLFNLTISLLVSLDKVKEATIMDLVYSILQPIAAVTLVYLGYGVLGAVAGIAFSIVIGTLLGFAYMSKAGFGIGTLLGKYDGDESADILKFSAPVATSNVALLGPANFAILLLGAYAATSIVGNYNAGYEIGNFVGIIFTSTTFVLLPFFASTFAKKDSKEEIGKMYNGSIYYTLLFLLPLLGFLIAVAQPLMYLLFSKAYALTPLYFSIIAVGTTLGIFGTYAGTVIIGYGDTKKFMAYQLLIVFIELLLLFILTPMYKGWGVLISLFIVAPIILDFVYLRALKKQFKFKVELKPVASLIIASLIMFAILYGASLALNQRTLSILVDLILALLIYPPLAVLLKGVTAKEIEFLDSLAKSYKLQSIAKYILGYAQFFIKEK